MTVLPLDRIRAYVAQLEADRLALLAFVRVAALDCRFGATSCPCATCAALRVLPEGLKEAVWPREAWEPGEEHDA